MPADKDMKILVVDDFSSMRRTIRKILNWMGFRNIVEAEDGRAAVKILESEKIDFIVADWNMPQMSGIDLLRHVRQTEAIKDMPFLMVTAEAQQESIIEAGKARVDQYIVKPFSPDTMKEKIEKIFP